MRKIPTHRQKAKHWFWCSLDAEVYLVIRMLPTTAYYCERKKYLREFCTGMIWFIPPMKQMFHVKHFCGINAWMTRFVFLKNAKIHDEISADPPTKFYERTIEFRKTIRDFKIEMFFYKNFRDFEKQNQFFKIQPRF